MEAAAQMEELRVELSLLWLPREVNEEADALSNLRTLGFSPEHRVDVQIDRLPLIVLPALMKEAEDFYVGQEKRAGAPRRGRKRRPLRETQPW